MKAFFLTVSLCGLAAAAWLLSASAPVSPARPQLVRRPVVAVAPRPAATPGVSMAVAPPPAPIDVTTAVLSWQPAAIPGIGFGPRPAEESMMSTWAARDPEAAGRWLDLNRQHPNFAAMVRGYAVQAATIDPAAARKWAALLHGRDNVFCKGGTLEQHIDAIETMLRGPQPEGTAAVATQNQSAPMLFADYHPTLVRPAPGAEPVLGMVPVQPFT